MPSSNARQRSREATRERLLRAGAELFAERGVRATRAADVSRRAGVAVGTLYLHFGGKEGLARAVAERGIEDLGGRLRDVHVREFTDAPEAVRAHAEAMVCFAEERAPLARVLFAGNLAVADPGVDVLERLAVHQEERLREGMAQGLFRPDVDPEVAAQALVGMLSRVLGWWIADPSRASRESVIDTMAKLRLSGLHALRRSPSESSSPATER